MGFQLISGDQDVELLVRAYRDRGLPGEPASSDMQAIAADLDRTIPWVVAIATKSGLDIDDVLLRSHAEAVLYALSYFDDLKYLQGYDRIVLITCLVTVAGFGCRLGEALAYYISLQWIAVADAQGITGGGDPRRQWWFVELDRAIERRFKDLWRKLKDLGCGSSFFATWWRIVLFLDVHDLRILPVLDAIARSRRREALVLQLCVAHVGQIARLSPRKGDDADILGRIQAFRAWDVSRLLRDAQAWANEERRVPAVGIGVVAAVVGIGAVLGLGRRKGWRWIARRGR